MASKPVIWVTEFNRVELANSIHFQVFRARIDLGIAALAWNTFEQECIGGVWMQIQLPDTIWDRTILLARQYGPILGVRTLDSLHVACALELGAKRFWTFDERQAKLAEAAGLDTRAET